MAVPVKLVLIVSCAIFYSNGRLRAHGLPVEPDQDNKAVSEDKDKPITPEAATAGYYIFPVTITMPEPKKIEAIPIDDKPAVSEKGEPHTEGCYTFTITETIKIPPRVEGVLIKDVNRSEEKNVEDNEIVSKL